MTYSGYKWLDFEGIMECGMCSDWRDDYIYCKYEETPLYTLKYMMLDMEMRLHVTTTGTQAGHNKNSGMKKQL